MWKRGPSPKLPASAQMSWPGQGRTVLFCGLLVALCLLLSACVKRAAFDLLEVEGLTRDVVRAEEGLEIQALGLPERRPAQVLLDGWVYAPGEAPRALELSLTGQSLARHLARAEFSPAALRRLLGSASHITFRGQIALEFAPQHPGGPELRGSKDAISFDLLASHSRTSLGLGLLGKAGSPSAALSGRPSFSAYLGLELDASCLVTAVAPGGPAESLGLAAGDVLLELDGLRLNGPEDFYPAPGLSFSRLFVRHAGSSLPKELELPRASYQPDAQSRVQLLLMGLVAVLAGLGLAARPPRLLIYWGARWARRREGQQAQIWPSPFGLSTLKQNLLFAVVVLSLWWAASLRNWASGAELLFCLGLVQSLRLLAAWLEGGRTSSGFRVFPALLAVTDAALLSLLWWASWALRCLPELSLHFASWNAEQGLWPTDFALFRSPWELLAGLSALLLLLPLPGRRPPTEAAQKLSRGAAEFEFLALSFGVGLWVLAYTGSQTPDSWPDGLGGALFCWKAALVLALVLWAQTRLGQERLSELRRAYLGLGAGLLLLATAALVLARSLEQRGLDVALLSPMSLGLALSLSLFGVVAASRAWAHRGRVVDPWI